MSQKSKNSVKSSNDVEDLSEEENEELIEDTENEEDENVNEEEDENVNEEEDENLEKNEENEENEEIEKDNEECSYSSNKEKNLMKDDDEEDLLVDEIVDDDSDNPIEIPKEERRTFPYLTQYEFTRILGERTAQISGGAKPMLTNVSGLKPSKIAFLEIQNNTVPMKIRRWLPNNKYEIWNLSELRKDNLIKKIGESKANI